jgi:hypothetical protein
MPIYQIAATRPVATPARPWSPSSKSSSADIGITVLKPGLFIP